MDILLVDDDKESLDALHSQLESDGHKCVSKTNPLEAIKVYSRKKFNCVITDVRMPELNGIELLKRIRKKDRQARVIIITAYGDLETATAAINNRAWAFFGKPLDLEDLLNTLQEMEKEMKDDVKPAVDYQKLKQASADLKKVYGQLLDEIKKVNGMENGQEKN